MRTRAALVALTILAAASTGRAETIDDFEAEGTFAAWSFSNGAEFPGATGSIERVSARSGSAARINYDFSAGGAYVAVSRAVNSSPGRPLALWVRADLDVSVVIRLTDSEGQTLQYELPRPFEIVQSSDWLRRVLPSSALPNDHWGGADDGVLHGNIRAVSVLITRSDLAPIAGSIELDDVAFLDPAPFELDPFAPGAELGNSDLFERWGAAIHFTQDDRALDALAAAGFRWVRMDLFWSWVERERGVYDFSAFDELLEDLEARSLRAILILDYGNDLYGGGPPKTDEAIAAFAAYAKAAAEHFAGRGVVFEVWNEPDNNFWPPGNVPLEYAALLPHVIEAVHTGDSNGLVSTGGVSWFDWDYFATYLQTRAAEGADFIAVHGYRNSPPETCVADFTRLRALSARWVTNDAPVINTEWGYTASSFGDDGTQPAARHRQAVWAVRQQISTWVAEVPISIWYDVRDDCEQVDNGECHFGLLARDYSDKPAMTALRALSDAARDRRLDALLSTPETPRAIRLNGEQDLIVVTWASEPGTTSVLNAPMPRAARDVYGQPIAIGAGGQFSTTLDEAAGPIYLYYDKPAGNGGAGGSAAAGGSGNGASGSANGPSVGGSSSSPTDPSSGTNEDGEGGGCGCVLAARANTRALSLCALAVFALGLARRHRARCRAARLATTHDAISSAFGAPVRRRETPSGNHA